MKIYILPRMNISKILRLKLNRLTIQAEENSTCFPATCKRTIKLLRRRLDQSTGGWAARTSSTVWPESWQLEVRQDWPAGCSSRAWPFAFGCPSLKIRRKGAHQSGWLASVKGPPELKRKHFQANLNELLRDSLLSKHGRTSQISLMSDIVHDAFWGKLWKSSVILPCFNKTFHQRIPF